MSPSLVSGPFSLLNKRTLLKLVLKPWSPLLLLILPLYIQSGLLLCGHICIPAPRTLLASALLSIAATAGARLLSAEQHRVLNFEDDQAEVLQEAVQEELLQEQHCQ